MLTRGKVVETREKLDEMINCADLLGINIENSSLTKHSVGERELLALNERNTHTANINNLFKCNMCEFKTHNKKNLNQHFTSHTKSYIVTSVGRRSVENIY